MRDFGKAIEHGAISLGGNPPFSLILKGVRYLEDCNDILTILREYKLCDEKNEAVFQNSLQNGSLLLSQLSEYAAIYLAHRLRRFDVSIQLGLSEELHPSKNYQNENRGLVSRYSLKQNIDETVDLKNKITDPANVLLSTTSTLEGHSIHRYIKIITCHTLIDEDELKRLHHQDETSVGMNEIYQSLASQLKDDACKLEANAVVGVNYQITPLVGEKDASSPLYKITCSGNAVLVSD